MKYVSTRSGDTVYLFEEILFSGYASDGGLYMPVKIPQLTKETLAKWHNLSYVALLKEIARHFISEDEVSSHDLNDVVDKAFGDFQPKSIIPIARLDEGLNVAELFHGDTLAFKDLALSFVAQLLEYFLAKRKKRIIVLVGTSGDTGSSAIHSMHKLQCVDVIVLYPQNGCTHLQELQMITVLDDNVHCFAVEGSADDLDVPIKNCFMDELFVEQYNLCCVNSINWARIMGQIAHFFYVYFQMSSSLDSVLEVVVPTGAAGNITAGCIAKRMGLPFQLISCNNENNVVQTFLTEGVYLLPPQVIHTLAPAMDIQVAYNVERLLHLIAEGNFQAVEQFFSDFENERIAKLTPELTLKFQKLVSSAHSYNDEIIENTIKKVWEQNQYRICPHTATAVAYHYEQLEKLGNSRNGSGKRVCIATASPDKFPEVLAALGIESGRNPKLQHLETAPTKFATMKRGQNWDAILLKKIKEIYDSRNSLDS